MFGRSKAVESIGAGVVRRLLGATLAAVAFVIVMISGGEAHACHPGMNSGTSISVVHKVEGAAAVTLKSASRPIESRSSRSVTIGSCCGGTPHSNPGCQSGCCAACSAAVDLTNSGLDLSEEMSGHVFAKFGDVVSTKPPPDFRPPRSPA